MPLVLSASITALGRDGDTAGRYMSRSEAVLATALAAASAGWTEQLWREVLQARALGDWAGVQHRKTGGRRPRNPADADRRLVTTWAKAVRRSVERPPAADAPSVRAELAEVLAAADRNPAVWRGAAGVTDRAVLAALVEIAVSACTLTPSASTRQLSEAVNISPATAAVALVRLRGRGWLRLEQAAGGTHAPLWRLVRPTHLPAPARAVERLLEPVPARPVTPVGGSALGHDAFSHTIHGGPGRVAARLFDALDDGVRGGLSVRQLGACTGLHPRTIGRHLIALQAAGLVSAGGGGRSWTRSLSAGDPRQLAGALTDAAVLLGCAGLVEARRVRHVAHRLAFVTYWTDFAARRGWSVQRAGCTDRSNPRCRSHKQPEAPKQTGDTNHVQRTGCTPGEGCHRAAQPAQVGLIAPAEPLSPLLMTSAHRRAAITAPKEVPGDTQARSSRPRRAK